MRFADILIDLASVAQATKGVASRHWELRARQIDRYSRTSSIARSLRNQQAGRDARTTPAAAPAGAESGTPPASPASTSATATTSKSASAPSAVATAPADHASVRVGITDARSPQKEPAAWQQPVKENKLEDDAPPGVNLDVFHTTRGSQLRDGKNDSAALKRPITPPPSPSWFKDFGHGKGESVEVKNEPVKETTVPSQAPPSQPSPSSQEVNPQTDTATSPATPPRKDIEPKAPQTKAVEENTEKLEKILAESGAQQAASPAAPLPPSNTESDNTRSRHALRESKVPASRFSRMWNYGGLAAGMLGGAITETFSRGLGGGGSGSVMLSAGNMERLVAKLSRMRGAALKLGQMMSFQDAKMLPAPIQEVLQRVQDRADYMPSWQRDRVLTASLGPQWRDLFEEFSETPIAAASIGQVHTGVLKATGEKVAIKIQFPGVADSITSDLDNLSMLLTASKLLPKGLYLNKTIDNMRTELGWECDYIREAECAARYRELLVDEPDVFVVPKMYAEACGKHVLTMEFMQGVGVTRVKSFTQEQRDWIGTQILRLCLRELTEFRFMQTDPNWTNFQYNAATNKLELLDFGASREFPLEFVEQYVNLLAAAARSDRPRVKELSESLGYLTGHESTTMVDAHITSVLTLAEPFLGSAPEVYDFQDQTITERVKALIPVMINERLAPPPEETYSLHRKLSGAFLLCARLGSRVACRELFDDAIKRAPFPVER
ncbi:ABC1 family-domain-containing protein [Microdochium trichocladiopsis]|uniref:ABC1 family-domain-containing protein n=1 Tax=Microdochium trichocladiopsis TaxID=1682393 RepID=A0A9P8Y9C2_9PEZI|nr:ABC1 family-domain-containing protein [Microdochium trichocladiopsis]KAH7032956.1 ABC1 family-domain-containing protein [Microdochium trichocladiopsis]